MRSVSVVLPESMWAEMPMLRIRGATQHRVGRAHHRALGSVDLAVGHREQRVGHATAVLLEEARRIAGLLALGPERIDLFGELGEELVEHLADEPRLDALDGLEALLHREAREPALGGDLLVDELLCVGDDGLLLCFVLEHFGERHVRLATTSGRERHPPLFSVCPGASARLSGSASFCHAARSC
jgi:hypothetical protein